MPASRRRSSSRSRRRTRFRCTAPPSVRGVDSPIRVSARSVLNDRRTRSGVERLEPRRPIASKSARRRMVGSAGIVPETRTSGAEPLAPLGATTSEHAPTALRGHAGHEAVLALPRALLGLIGPLHGCVPFLVGDLAFRTTNTRTAGVPPACARSRGGPFALGGILVSRGTSVKRRRASVPALRRTRDIGPFTDPSIGHRAPATPNPCRAADASVNPAGRRSRTALRPSVVALRRDRKGPERPIPTGRLDPLPGRFGRCYSGPHPRPGPPDSTSDLG